MIDEDNNNNNNDNNFFSFSFSIRNNLEVVYETKAMEVMYYERQGMHERAEEIMKNRKFPLPEKVVPTLREIEFESH